MAVRPGRADSYFLVDNQAIARLAAEHLLKAGSAAWPIAVIPAPGSTAGRKSGRRSRNEPARPVALVPSTRAGMKRRASGGRCSVD